MYQLTINILTASALIVMHCIFLFTVKNGYLLHTAQPLLLEHMIQFATTINYLFI